jgi:hypothetical protein
MQVFRNVSLFLLLSTSVAAAPSPKRTAHQYAQAKHIIPLYRTDLPATGNFEASITVGNQSVTAILDTGSSDIWFMQQDSQCLDPQTKQTSPIDLCGFGGPKLTPTTSFHEIPDAHMNDGYANGAGLLSTVAYSQISFGGLVVPQQEFGLVETTDFHYNGRATGLIGLGYPVSTQVYPGNDTSTDMTCNITIEAENTACNQQYYSPLLSTIFAEGLTPPIFSFAISRSATSGGTMAIGGIPDIHSPQINVTRNAPAVTVPNEKVKGWQFLSQYVTTVTGLDYVGASAGAGKGQYAVDTGTVPIITDNTTAQAFNSRFDPPAWYNETMTTYVVQCNATAPHLSVEIAGTSFPVNPRDLILDLGPQYPYCASGMQAGASTAKANLLGSVWLRGVLAVFDVGNSEMFFTSRAFYQE